MFTYIMPNNVAKNYSHTHTYFYMDYYPYPPFLPWTMMTKLNEVN